VIYLIFAKKKKRMSMLDMMGKVKDMQAKMLEAQEKLGDIVTEAESGGGMVKVTVNGKKELLSIEIEPELLNPTDAKMVQDLIVAATNKALADIDDKVKSEMSKVTEGMMPKIPGFDLGNIFNK
jgi:DNA-binding YbaB/EbfC family protein